MHTDTTTGTPEDELSAGIEALLLKKYSGTDGGLGIHSKFKKIARKVKSVSKSILKGVKKAAPAALAAVATVYGGPAAGSAVLALASSTAKSAKTKKRLALASGAMGAYAVYKKFSPTMSDAAAGKVGETLSAKGINMNSPAAKALISKYMAGRQKEIQTDIAKARAAKATQLSVMQAKALEPQTPALAQPAVDLTKYILPVVAAGGALLMLKG